MKVFVTGASGFIGGAIAERCRERGDEVTGVDLRPDPERGVVAGDIAVAGAWQDAARDADVVVHTAAFVGFRRRRPDEIWRVNALGTKNALDAARAAGARLVHFSSITVFGLGYPDRVGEDHPTEPTGIPYADTKIAAEALVLAAHAAGDAEVVVIRPGDVYGPRSDPWAVRPVELMKAGRFAIPDGVLSPVYVDSLVDAVLLAAASPAAAGRVFTVTDGPGVSNREFFSHYARLLGRRLVVLPRPAALALGAVGERLRLSDDVNVLAMRYLARRGTYSNERARSVLGWSPAVEFEDGMARTCEWLRASGHV